MLYVTYAKKNSQTGEEETGNGKGYINVFNPDGSFVKRFASGGKLNAPWGMVKAPAGFWGSGSQLTNMILVGNFGNGQINVFDENGNSMGLCNQKANQLKLMDYGELLSHRLQALIVLIYTLPLVPVLNNMA
jgi:uncharacterized protein (TIGR03118 family)